MKHAAHRIHENSREAYHAEKEKLGDRSRAIYDWIEKHGPCTDRQVKNGMGFIDMNAVRPRITEMVESKLLMEIHTKALCPISGRRVRLVSVMREPQQLAFT